MNIKELIDTTIRWTAPAYEGNGVYKGIALIKGVDFSKKRAIIVETIEGDDLSYAFLDNHGLSTKDGGETYQMTDNNFCFSYSDSFREVFFEKL